MHMNMNFFDVMVRYFLLMTFVILGGVLQSLPLMLVGMVFFFAAISGICPIFKLFGINHHKGGMLSDSKDEQS